MNHLIETAVAVAVGNNGYQRKRDIYRRGRLEVEERKLRYPKLAAAQKRLDELERQIRDTRFN